MTLAEYWTTTSVLLLTRVAAFFSVFPLFQGGALPRSIKTALAFGLTGMWLVNLAIDHPESLPPMMSSSWIELSLAIGREALLGAILAYLLGLFFLPAQIAGAFIGQEIGFHMPGAHDPTTGTANNVVGDLLHVTAVLVFFAIDGHLLIVGTLYSSLEVIPVSTALPTLTPTMFSKGFSDANRWGLELASPVTVALLLISTVTMLLMKISPQLNLFAVGISLRLLLGLGACFLFFPDLVTLMVKLLEHQVDFVHRLGF